MRNIETSLCLVLCGLALGCSSSENATGKDSGSEASQAEAGPSGDGGPSDAGPSDGTSGDGLAHIDRSNLTDAGLSGSLDYSNPSLWLCRPGIDQNPCYGNLDATELLPDGGQQLLKHTRAPSPKFDCFYVYPTVDLTTNGNMTDFSDITDELDPLIAQAAPFNEVCEIYAPLYRQVAFTPGGGTSDAASGIPDGGVGTLQASSGAALALQDVRDAFKYYLAHLNSGRKFVLMGHSQGTLMLTAMMKTDVDPVATVRSQMISAVLIGGAATGGATANAFQNIKACTKPGETGCVVAYSSYDVKNPPGSNALFGLSSDGSQTDCTNPSTLAGSDSGVYHGSMFPTMIRNPLLAADTPPIVDAGTTPFVLYRDVFEGNCIVDDAGRSYLQVQYLGQPGDPRGVPPYIATPAENLGFGLHLVDYAIPNQELLSVVTQQGAAAVP